MSRDGAVVAALARAGRLHAEGCEQEARAACLEILRGAPDCVDALRLLGRIDEAAGRLNIAERTLRRAVAIAPENAACAHALGRLLSQRGEHREALEQLTRAIELDPAPAEPWHDRGRLHHLLQRLPEAEADLRAAVARAPDRPHALDELGVVLDRQQRADEALHCFERAIRAQPGYAPAHDHLGLVHFARGRIAQATRCFENAVHHDAALAPAHDHLGLVLSEQARAADAIVEHERATALAPQCVPYVVHRARAAFALGRVDEAEAGYRDALARAPHFDHALAGLASLMDARGDYQPGLELVEVAAARRDASPDLRIACARLLSRVYRVPEALALLEPLAAEPARRALTVAQSRALEFALGDLRHLGGDYPRAFACWERGNGLKAAGFDSTILHAQVDAAVATFSAEAMTKLPRVAQAAPELLFIVGMPGAGGGLVQRILASHPHASVAPAPVALATVAQRLAMRARAPYPRCMREIDAAAAEQIAGDYRAALPMRSIEAQYVVHRAAGDCLHLALVELLFPRARVVHCVRDELDSGLSCFSRDSVDPALAFGASLHGIGVMTLAHRRLMAHWRKALRVPIFEVAYEALVADPEREIRALTSFLGLPWTAACLRFHESKRAHAVITGRPLRPIHTGSVGRHARYASMLEPLREMLAKA